MSLAVGVDMRGSAVAGHWRPSRLLQQIAESGGKLREARGKVFS